jgi:hypothetical protein
LLLFSSEFSVLQINKITTKFKMYEILISIVLLYRFKIWSLKLREEQRLGVFEDKVLRRIFQPQKEKETRRWREGHN